MCKVLSKNLMIKIGVFATTTVMLVSNVCANPIKIPVATGVEIVYTPKSDNTNKPTSSTVVVKNTPLQKKLLAINDAWWLNTRLDCLKDYMKNYHDQVVYYLDGYYVDFEREYDYLFEAINWIEDAKLRIYSNIQSTEITCINNKLAKLNDYFIEVLSVYEDAVTTTGFIDYDRLTEKYNLFKGTCNELQLYLQELSHRYTNLLLPILK